MSCERWYATLARVSDDADADADAMGELDPQTRQALTDHLAGCRDCREALDEQRTVRRLLTSRVDARPPTGFAERVVSRLDTGPSWMDALRWRTWTYRLAPVAAGLLVFAVVTTWATTPTGNATETTDGLPDLAESWAFGEQDVDARPAFTLWGRDDVTPDMLLEALLSVEPDTPFTQEDVS